MSNQYSSEPRQSLWLSTTFTNIRVFVWAPLHVYVLQARAYNELPIGTHRATSVSCRAPRHHRQDIRRDIQPFQISGLSLNILGTSIPACRLTFRDIPVCGIPFPLSVVLCVAPSLSAVSLCVVVPAAGRRSRGQAFTPG